MIIKIQLDFVKFNESLSFFRAVGLARVLINFVNQFEYKDLFDVIWMRITLNDQLLSYVFKYIINLTENDEQ